MLRITIRVRKWLFGKQWTMKIQRCRSAMRRSRLKMRKTQNTLKRWIWHKSTSRIKKCHKVIFKFKITYSSSETLNLALKSLKLVWPTLEIGSTYPRWQKLKSFGLLHSTNSLGWPRNLGLNPYGTDQAQILETWLLSCPTTGDRWDLA